MNIEDHISDEPTIVKSEELNECEYKNKVYELYAVGILQGTIHTYAKIIRAVDQVEPIFILRNQRYDVWAPRK